MGGLLHDLIMRRPLFKVEDENARVNRYRIAHTVATTIPDISAGDVSSDLLSLARRALDKDWRRRSQVKIEDFFSDTAVRQRNALSLIGIGRPPNTLSAPIAERSAAECLRRLRSIAEETEKIVTAWLKEQGVTAEHRIAWRYDTNSVSLCFTWAVDGANVQLAVPLSYRVSGDLFYEQVVELKTTESAGHLDMPPVLDGNDAPATLAQQVIDAVPVLADNLMRKAE
jgi:hypothetical protein